MTPRWRLEVEELGKIERAKVDIRPLTLLVGPNNTGKSYLASLLWGLVAMQGDLEPPEGPERDAVDAWLRSKLPSYQSLGAGAVELESDAVALLEDLFRVTLRAHAGGLTRRIFNSESMHVGQIDFRNMAVERQLRLESSLLGERYELRIVADSSGWWIAPPYPPGVEGPLPAPIITMVRDMLMRYAAFGSLTLDDRYADKFTGFSPIYLPASRTGFMQLYKAAARRSLEDAAFRRAEDAKWLDLTRPAFQFIDMIGYGLKAKPAGQYAEEADFLEREITGKLELIEALGGNEYRYHPVGAAVPLTMSLSSALVTELAPLILVLRHVSNFPVLVVEEPEAHLHPELQRRLAQVIVRLIRKRLTVWITTHSDYFCQEINNFIKLGALAPDRRAEAHQKLRFGPQDFLELEDVSAYEVKPDESGERSTVVEMKRTGAGLVLPTFNRSIVQLNKDVAYLDSLLSGDDP